jgi:uncharacterized protein with HEPN domain
LKSTKSVTEYSANFTVTDAVERRLAIIGEALWKAKKIDDSVIVTDEKRIIGLRHILVHDYDYIDDPTIWKICQNNLPVLKMEVLNLIEEQRNKE